MSKKITVPPRPQPSNPPASAAEWIGRTESPIPPPVVNKSIEEPLVRLTFDIPESLHRRIKMAHAQKGIKRMAVELRRILEEQYPIAP
jgi:hypothetical protein